MSIVNTEILELLYGRYDANALAATAEHHFQERQVRQEAVLADPTPVPELDPRGQGYCNRYGVLDEYYPENPTAKMAKAACMGCLIQSECLEYALANQEVGIWGGTTERQRVNILNRRQEAEHQRIETFAMALAQLTRI